MSDHKLCTRTSTQYQSVHIGGWRHTLHGSGWQRHDENYSHTNDGHTRQPNRKHHSRREVATQRSEASVDSLYPTKTDLQLQAFVRAWALPALRNNSRFRCTVAISTIKSNEPVAALLSPILSRTDRSFQEVGGDLHKARPEKVKSGRVANSGSIWCGPIVSRDPVILYTPTAWLMRGMVGSWDGDFFLGPMSFYGSTCTSHQDATQLRHQRVLRQLLPSFRRNVMGVWIAR